MKGNNSIFLRRSFFPRYALGMPSFNNSVYRTILKLILAPAVFFTRGWFKNYVDKMIAIDAMTINMKQVKQQLPQLV